MAALGDCHKLFLQAMMGKGVAKAVEVKDLYKRAAQACGGELFRLVICLSLHMVWERFYTF